MNRERLKNSIQQHEGCIDHMYLDTRGNVTIGIGQLLPSIKFAQTLRLVLRDSGEVASAEQIAEDFVNVGAQNTGMVAARYKPFTRLELSHDEIDSLLDHHIDKFSDGLAQKIDDFDSFPDPAQEALMDMAFNLGLSGLVRKFPKLVSAAGRQDWETCAAECRRRGIGKQRNQATRELFESAKPDRR